jgi:protein-disulfide isomerase
VTIDDPQPSAYLPGFSELAVHLSYQGQNKDEHYYISQNGKSIVKGEVYDLTKSPFQPAIDHIKLDSQPSYGKSGAPVTIVVYGDFECPVCKVEADVMRKNLVQTFPDKVRVYFKDFPLESIHPWARAASNAGRCIYKQDPQAFWKFHDWIYENQDGVTPDTLNSKVMTWAGTSGIDAIQLGRCVDGKVADKEVAQNMAEARSLGLDATPTLYINGRKFVGALEWPVLQQLITLEIEHAASAPKTTAKAEDAKCEETCVVNIPKIASK